MLLRPGPVRADLQSHEVNRETRRFPTILVTVRVIVIGGGIVGLATAYRLGERMPSAEITLLEKESEVGKHQILDSGVACLGAWILQVPMETSVTQTVDGFEFADKFLVMVKNDIKTDPSEGVGRAGVRARRPRSVAESPDTIRSARVLFKLPAGCLQRGAAASLRNDTMRLCR